MNGAETGAGYFVHADSIWNAHPKLRAHAVVVDGVPGMKSDPERLERLKSGIERRLASHAESEMPEIAAWRDAFSRMGLKPTQYRCASEALLRRYRKEGSMPTFHPLVDYLNFVSMLYAIPIAAFDCERIVGGITVRAADGSETYETFQGDIEHPVLNETIFADDRGNAHSRRWTHRQSARSVVTPRTNRALIVAEALHDSAAQDLLRLADELQFGLADSGARSGESMNISSPDRRFAF